MYQQPMQPGMQQPNMYQQPMQQPMQPGMMPGMGMPQGGMGMPQGGMMGPQINLIKMGNGIDQNEYATITGIASQNYAMTNGKLPLSTNIANGIKQALKGNWFVFVAEASDNAFNFALTCVKGGDFVIFTINNLKFQCLRLA